MERMKNNMDEKICQSCGMPLTEEAQFAKNADGSVNEDYCCYCMKEGVFTPECTMEEMADFCAPMLVKEGVCADAAAAKAQMMAYFPTLKRWKKD